MSDTFFEIKTPLEVTIRTTREYWNYIVTIKHPFMNGKEESVKNALFQPDEIRKSRMDDQVFLYYRREEEKLFCAVARHTEKEGHLVTAYVTDKVKEGEVIWTR